MAVRRVDHDEIDAGLDQGQCALVGILADADRRADDEPAACVLRGKGKRLALGEVLDRDQPGQPALGVDQGQLLDLVPGERAQSVVVGNADRAR